MNYQNSTCEPWILELSWTLGIGSQPGAACQSCLGHLASRMLGMCSWSGFTACLQACEQACESCFWSKTSGPGTWCYEMKSWLYQDHEPKKGGFKSDGTFHAKTLPLGRWRYANSSWRHLVGSLTIKTFGAPWLYHMILHGSLRKFSNIWSTFFPHSRMMIWK